jgi:hypothetical protein
VRDILKKAPGVVVIDDRASNRFLTLLEVSNIDDVAAFMSSKIFLAKQLDKVLKLQQYTHLQKMTMQ